LWEFFFSFLVLLSLSLYSSFSACGTYSPSSTTCVRSATWNTHQHKFYRECASLVEINKNIPNGLSIIMLIIKTITSAYQSVNHFKKNFFFLLGITYTEENEHRYSLQ
jgi:hypothetical protein